MNSKLKTLFNPGNYPKNIDLALLILRIALGTFMLTHGWGKFLRFFGDGPITFGDPIGIGPTASLILVVFAEVFCSILIVFGLGTRLAAIPIIIAMLVASLIANAGNGFAKQELALFYAITSAVLMITGSGKYSVDEWIYTKKRI